MSLTSAECTEVKYATELYSDSPPPVGTKTDKGDTAPRKRRRGFALRIQLSWILQATKLRLPLNLFIYWKFTAGSTTTKRSSAGLLTAPSSFAMQSALPWAKATLLHLRMFVSSPRLYLVPLFHRLIGGKSAPASALAPLGGVCGRQRLRGMRYIFTALF
jgi:hypothetical protein